jgi:DNA-binding GntR family transcriptional regulator
MPNTSPSRRQQAATATQRVYDGIHQAIIEHRLSPGMRLREEELAESFQVSRTLVRQALQRLAADHVIELRHNIGAQVPQPDLAQAAQVFEARSVIECDVVRRLAGHVSPAQLQGLRHVVQTEQQARLRGDVSAAIRLSGEFHLELARLDGNPVFLRWINELLPITSLLIALYQRDGVSGCLSHDHTALVDALATASPARCATVMRQHLQELQRSLAQATPQPATPLRDVFAAYRSGAALAD